ncbi:TIGR01777 family oxidoreductase [Sinomicrobium soli]|uniref:TIGR01777 family oxidoreductase n=1 Tax=Sinomicrobium sp. N-1-3-6 TaxID=2219864 RepID=UPI000DCD1797|nr:TIGR01777 family oxidoreductase [Sinomicrobium sp. N-1-3-6]RAV29899.1 TIGR01777 family protein [Sinomicrobium sp. N-1-3-6]
MRILVTGATGLVGSEITALCEEQGVEVHYLTTSRSKIRETKTVKGFYWNPQSGEIDRKCLEGVEAIINLAGTAIAQRWTPRARKQIVDSRVEALQLLHRTLACEEDHRVRMLLSASAIGIYPDSLGHYYEEIEKNTDPTFPGEVIRQWETAADSVERLGIKVAKIRIGLVLSDKGGALPRMAGPVKYWAGAPLGRGIQWQSWIHITDLARLFLFVLDHDLPGVFNGVAPNPVTNKELTAEIAAKLRKPLILPNVPAFALYWLFGKMAYLMLSSQRVSSRKITDMGFSFRYSTLREALDAIYAGKKREE